MTEIYLSEPQTTRSRRHCFRIEIDNPNAGAQVIHFHQENITETEAGDEISRSSTPSIAVAVLDITTKTIQITDAVTGEPLTMSGAAAMAWIEQCYVDLAVESLKPDTTGEVE